MDLVKYLYPQPKALSRVYGCCVYYTTDLDDMVCHPLDDECISEFRSLLNMYYIWGTCLVAAGLIAMTSLMVHAKLTYKSNGKVELKEEIIKKTGPLHIPKKS